MLVYKYLPIERVDVLEQCQIRFTQYGDFNDPFELNPNITMLANEGDMNDILTRDFEKIALEEYENNPIIANFIRKDQYIQFAKSKEDEIRKLVRESAVDLVGKIPAVLQRAANSHIGALSLSETFSNVLMWSHYASQHRGYVIAFDASHAFFD